MINTAQPASKSIYAEKNGFDITNLIFQNMYVWQCGAAVKELLAAADEPGSTPGNTAFSVSLYRFFPFFFLFSLCFLARFFLLACFSLFVLLTLLIMHLDQYIFLSFSPELYFRKGTKLVHHKLFLFTPNNLWRNLTCLLFIVLIITILLP